MNLKKVFILSLIPTLILGKGLAFSQETPQETDSISSVKIELQKKTIQHTDSIIIEGHNGDFSSTTIKTITKDSRLILVKTSVTRE